MYWIISLSVAIIELLKSLYVDKEYLDEFETWVEDISTALIVGFSWKYSIPILIFRNLIIAYINSDEE